jgi:uncharacterized RDD family membrane protein YckC
MRCPKCHYISFGSVERCRNCGYELSLAAPAENQSIDLPIHGDDQPSGPLGDFVLSERASAPSPPPVSSRDQAGSAIGRRAAAVARLDLPLFSDKTAAGDDAPLVSAPAVPRTPLSVRRAAPAVVRARSEPADPSTAVHRDVPPAGGVRQRAANGREQDPQSNAAAVDDGVLASASVVRRVLAGLLDAIVIGATDAAVVYVTLRAVNLPYTDVLKLPLVPMSVFFVLLNGGYLALFTTACGQTIGKMLTGIKVVSDVSGAESVAYPDSPYLRVPLGSAVLRASAYLVSLLPVGLGFLPILTAPDGRALHDRLAGTRVVKA